MAKQKKELKKDEKKEDWICNICKADSKLTKKDWTFKNKAGLMGHDSLKHSKPPEKIDKESEQEKYDKRELSDLSEIMKSRMQNPEKFSPEEVDSVRSAIQPLKERQMLRQGVAVEELRARQEEAIKRQRTAKQDDDEDYAPSWKDIDKQKRRKIAYGGENNSMDQFYQAQMLRDDRIREREREIDRENFKERLETQKQIFQIGADSNKQTFEILKQQVADAKREKDPIERLKEFKDWASSEGLSKEGESMVNTLITNNMPHVLEMWRDYMSLKKQQTQGYFNPLLPQQQAPQIIKNEKGEVIKIIEYPQPAEIINPESNSSINHHQLIPGGQGCQISEELPAPQQNELTDQEVQKYSQTHDLSDYGDFHSTSYSALNSSMDQYINARPRTSTA